MNESPPELSIVVPVFNEEPCLDRLYAELTEALEAFGRSYEVVAVDDGSCDASFAILSRFHAQDARWRIVRLMRNFGQHPATYAGMERARGSIIVTIDADLQNPPKEIPTVVRKLEEGYDVVQGWRQQRQDHRVRRVLSKSINALVSRITGITVRDIGCALKAFRREAALHLAANSHLCRYIPAEVAWHGLRVAEVAVGHREREHGDSKYGLFALLRVSFDMVASISSLPIRMVAPLGLVFAVGGALMSLRVAYVRITGGDINQMGTVVAVILLIAAAQMFAIAVICEYISRIYIEVQHRPYYIVRDCLDREDR
jgi:undecaprenyl-phosphate 4-deoxy-4-formamido-L-arabinose transferase